MTKRRWILVCGSVIATLVLLVGTAAAPAARPHSDKTQHLGHVFVIMMENTGIEALLGNPNAPWINQAVQTYGVAGNYYGVTHPSQPNYIAATAGTTQGVPDDNDVTVDLPNIVDQLESHHKSWKGYMQSYSLCTSKLQHACGNQLYERKHNPFISFADVQSNPSRLAKLVDLSQLSTDLASNHVPDYSWISPDQCNDMHGRGGGGSADPCDFSNEQNLIHMGDTFLANTVGEIMSSKAWGPNSVIFVTWDESDFTNSPTDFGFGDTRGCCDANPGGGHVLTLVITGHQHQARASFTPYNHYSMLRTIEDSWHLGCLAHTCDTANVPAMTDLVDRRR
jgi:phosphatidylinositol-3-phosphatase